MSINRHRFWVRYSHLPDQFSYDDKKKKTPREENKKKTSRRNRLLETNPDRINIYGREIVGGKKHIIVKSLIHSSLRKNGKMKNENIFNEYNYYLRRSQRAGGKKKKNRNRSSVIARD